MYRLLAAGVLAVHLAWILWIIFGALFTRRRKWLARIHIVSLLYSIVIEAGSSPCPLTSLEQEAQQRAGLTPYQGDFLIHYLERVIYPDVPYAVLVPAAVAVCVFNLAVHVRRRFAESPR